MTFRHLENVAVRAANADDAAGVAAIYNLYVGQTVVTFEEEAVPPAEIARRMQDVAAASLPLLKENKPAPLEKLNQSLSVAAAVVKPHGVTVDYVVTVSSTVKPTIYTADTTYFVSGSVVESSAVTMESAVFKFPSNSGEITLEGTLTMATTNYRPAMFTAADDNTAGTTLSTSIWSGYTGIPTNGYYGSIGGALYLYTSANVAFNNVRFCYLNDAVWFGVSGHSKPATKGRMKTSHFEGSIAYCASNPISM